MLRRFLGAALLTVTLAAPAAAQTDLTLDQTLIAGGVTYTQFTVTTAGTFDIWTTSRLGTAGVTPFDPYIYLFAGFGTGGSLVSFNDDGCNFFFSQCGPALFFSNSILNNLLLGLGNYTLAVGGCCMNEASARSGVNSGNNYAGDYSARIASLESFGGGTGVASVEGQPTSAVPEPASMVLVATGLLGIGVVARRRRRTA